MFKTTVSDSFFRAHCKNPKNMYDLGSMYEEFNILFFDGDLPKLSFKEKKDKDGILRKTYPNLVWDGRLRGKTIGLYRLGSRGRGRIALSPKIVGDPREVRSTLLHEMLHKYLDLKGKDDGIKGHGPAFVEKSLEINSLCSSLGLDYRVKFYGQEIKETHAYAIPELTKDTVYSSKDLDISQAMKSIFNAAFGDKYSYHV